MDEREEYESHGEGEEKENHKGKDEENEEGVGVEAGGSIGEDEDTEGGDLLHESAPDALTQSQPPSSQDSIGSTAHEPEVGDAEVEGQEEDGEDHPSDEDIMGSRTDGNTEEVTAVDFDDVDVEESEEGQTEVVKDDHESIGKADDVVEINTKSPDVSQQEEGVDGGKPPGKSFSSNKEGNGSL